MSMTQKELIALSSKGVTQEAAVEETNRALNFIRNSITKNEAVMNGGEIRIVATVGDIDIDETFTASEIHDIVSEHYLIGVVSRALETRKKRATLVLKALMEQHGHIWPKAAEFGHKFCTVSESKEMEAEYFDAKRFQEEHPDLYAMYVKKREPSRNLYVK